MFEWCPGTTSKTDLKGALNQYYLNFCAVQDWIHDIISENEEH